MKQIPIRKNVQEYVGLYNNDAEVLIIATIIIF